MDVLFILDFDGVLFNSAYEAFMVCNEVQKVDNRFSKKINYDEFMEFRSVLTDAWQFELLFSNNSRLDKLSNIKNMEPDQQSWDFNKLFFKQREKLMKDKDWAKLMSPYHFFHLIKPLINKYPEKFTILSTRNIESIRRTLDFYGIEKIDIFGQEDIRSEGSKLAVANKHNLTSNQNYSIYIDDMNSHLEPFEKNVDLCIHAGWGYDKNQFESYTEMQAFNIISSLLKVINGN